MNIAIDIDSVLAHLMEEIIMKAKEIYDCNIEYDDITKYEAWECMKIDEKKFQNIIDELQKEQILKKLKIRGNAAEVINRLYDNKNNNIYFITARNDYWGNDVKENTLFWLRNNGIKLEPSNLIFNAEKHNFVDELKLDYFIEDSVHIVETLVDKEIKILLMDCPWNRNLKNDKVKRVYNWEEIGKELKDYFYKKI
jgi:uncharacterized protein